MLRAAAGAVVAEATLDGECRHLADALDRIAANDLARTRDALVLGDLDAAERRLGLARELAAASSDRDLLQPQVDELSETVAEHRAAARFETASELFADGDTRSALDIIEEILAELQG